jgi:hypothetical protein
MQKRGVPVHVRTGRGTHTTDCNGFTDTIEVVRRVPQPRKGWAAINYRGRRFQLHGGTRVPFFICPERRGA